MMDALTAVLGSTIIGSQVRSFQLQKQAAEQQQAARRLQARRQNVQALREAQIKRAMLQQSAAQTGTLDSSGFEGGVSSLQSQLGSNIGFANQLTAFGENQARYLRRAQTTTALSNLAIQGATFAAGQGMFSGDTDVTGG